MTARGAVWPVLALAALGTALAEPVAVLNGVGVAELLLLPVAVTSFVLTGVVLVRRANAGVVGMLLIVVGIAVLLLFGSGQYARYALKTRPGALPGPLVVAWGVGWTVPVLVAALAVWLPLVFPTGHLLSRRWRPVAWAAGVFVVLNVVTNGLLPDTAEVSGLGTVRNPFALTAAEPVLRAANGLDGLVILAAIVGSLASLVVRFRRSRGVERQQLKLVTTALALTPLPFLAHDLVPAATTLLFTLVIPLVPLAVAVAVLRYRLYDIDRLISRTVSYAVLTGLLIGSYVVIVTVATRLLPSSNSLAVAASTLAVAALFQPLRRRVQSAVDRRFNRARYDAEHTVYAFSRRLREEVELETVRADLLAVVRQTMQPTAAGLWLRAPAQVRR